MVTFQVLYAYSYKIDILFHELIKEDFYVSQTTTSCRPLLQIV